MISIFKQDIYPITLFISIDESFEDLENRFQLYLTDMKTKSSFGVINNDGYTVATTSFVKENDTSFCGPLIIVYNIEEFSTKVIAHESIHAADIYCDQLGIYTQGFNDGNESYAYLVGYIANCIDETVKNLKK